MVPAAVTESDEEIRRRTEEALENLLAARRWVLRVTGGDQQPASVDELQNCGGLTDGDSKRV